MTQYTATALRPVAPRGGAGSTRRERAACSRHRPGLTGLRSPGTWSSACTLTHWPLMSPLGSSYAGDGGAESQRHLCWLQGWGGDAAASRGPGGAAAPPHPHPCPLLRCSRYWGEPVGGCQGHQRAERWTSSPPPPGDRRLFFWKEPPRGLADPYLRRQRLRCTRGLAWACCEGKSASALEQGPCHGRQRDELQVVIFPPQTWVPYAIKIM